MSYSSRFKRIYNKYFYMGKNKLKKSIRYHWFRWFREVMQMAKNIRINQKHGLIKFILSLMNTLKKKL